MSVNPNYIYPATYQNPYMYYQSFQPTIVQPPSQQPVQQQNMMPVIQTSIIQVDGIDDVEKFQIGNGQSQMFISKDDMNIFVKSATANGSSVETYTKQPAKKAPEYVTKDQLEAMFKQLGIIKEKADESV